MWKCRLYGGPFPGKEYKIQTASLEINVPWADGKEYGYAVYKMIEVCDNKKVVIYFFERLDIIGECNDADV